MFNNVGKKQIKKIVKTNEKNQLMGVLTETTGFTQFIIYANAFNEGSKNLEKILEKSDLEDEMTYLVFKKIVLELYEESYEILFTQITNPYIKIILNEKLGWDEDFIENSEQLYHTKAKSLLKDDKQRMFLQYRLVTDILSKNFQNKYLKKLIFLSKEVDSYSQGLRDFVCDHLRKKLGLELNEYIFLSYVLKISLSSTKEKSLLVKELGKISKVNADFFTKEHTQLIQEMSEMT